MSVARLVDLGIESLQRRSVALWAHGNLGAVGQVVGVTVGVHGAAVHRRVQRADPRVGVLLVGAEGATDDVLNLCVLALFGPVAFRRLGCSSGETKEESGCFSKTENME